MFFNIFHRLSRKEKYTRKIRIVLRELGKVWNPDLISKLEEKDKSEVYFAIKGVIQDYILHRMPERYEEARQIMQSVGTAAHIERLKSISKDDPVTAFLFLIQIHARLLNEKDL